MLTYIRCSHVKYREALQRKHEDDCEVEKQPAANKRPAADIKQLKDKNG